MRVFTAKSIAWMAPLFFTAPAMAQSLDQHRANCASSDPNTLYLQITGCTAVIESGQQTSANLADAFYNRGNAYAQQEDYARAIADFDEAIRINPQDARAFKSRAFTYATQKDYARAISDYSQAIKINPQYTDAFFSRGGVYTTLKDYGRAISDFDEVIRLNPQSVLAFISRGIAKRLLGKTAEGDADLARARAMTPRRRP